jgi:hypothetical protein
VRKLKFNKFGLAEDPRHLHCAMRWNDRRMLGEIVRAQFNPVLGQTQLTVRHFNGELWPIQPVAMAVEILQ